MAMNKNFSVFSILSSVPLGHYLLTSNTPVMCGSLNVTGLHNLIWSGTLRRHGFGGVGMALALLCAFTRVVAKMGREECMLTCAEVHDHECSSPSFHVFPLFPNTCVSPLSSRWIPGRLVSLRTRKQPGENASKLPSH